MRWLPVALAVSVAACGGDVGDGDGDGVDAGAGNTADATPLPDAEPPVPQFAELWYSSDDNLVRFELDPNDGTVLAISTSSLGGSLELGQNLLTMLDDGSLVGGRLAISDNKTYLYHIPVPPRDGSAVTPVPLGVMIDDLMLEGLYTDCDGRLYGMDTGVDNSSSEGNRLLRFTGDVLAGDFTYTVVSDLATASVADIDDMGPAINANEIADNPGLAIDTGTVHAFDFETGSGTMIGSGGTFGIHALGRELFTDDRARLYVFNSDAELFEMDPVNFTVSAVLGQGPTVGSGIRGHSGLAGPLTDCDTGFTVD